MKFTTVALYVAAAYAFILCAALIHQNALAFVWHPFNYLCRPSPNSLSPHYIFPQQSGDSRTLTESHPVCGADRNNPVTPPVGSSALEHVCPRYK